MIEVKETEELALLEEMNDGLKCDECGEFNAAITICPFTREVDDRIVECVLCDDCYHERCMDI